MNTAMTEERPLLEIQDLSVSFQMYQKGWKRGWLEVISSLSLSLRSGELLAIVGSSGSGKSLLVSAILGILPPNARVEGQMFYRGSLLTAQSQRELRGKEMGLVPQSVAFLDPLMKVGAQVTGGRGSERKERMQKIFRRLDLPPGTENRYPFQLSGGMSRRVLVSTALVSQANLILADEPTPGMGLEQAMETLSILRSLTDQGKGVILITHDLDLALQAAHRIAVFYSGTILELVPAHQFLQGPEGLHHPYSRALWQAMPQNGFVPIPGFQPYGEGLPQGCLFSPRCPRRTQRCQSQRPPMRRVGQGEVRCFDGT